MTPYTRLHVDEAGSPFETVHNRADAHSTDERNIHWRVPAIMIGALIAGTAFALGHHFFNLHFNNHVVHGEDQQKWVSRFGTASAFLVKMCLAIATSAAYAQQFWLTLRSKFFRVERVDAMFAVLKDPTVFWDLRL
jgi:hypothetical protein